MKRLFLVSICIVFVMAPAPTQAQEIAPLGNSNFALKLDYINFTNDHFDSPNSSDGMYVGLEGYGKIKANLYLGGEVGTAVNLDLISGEDINFVPFELNLKYATEVAPNFVVDFGAGVSYSKVELTYDPLFGPAQRERSDWLLGGQFFADLTYKINWFSVGGNAKYQITEDFQNESLDLSNWRIGVQIGITY
jgi:hypothetical protein